MLLARSDYCGREIVRLLGQPQNLVSYHLRRLYDQHLVTERRSTADGRDIYYSLDIDTLRTLYFAAGDSLNPALNVSESSLQRNCEYCFSAHITVRVHRWPKASSAT